MTSLTKAFPQLLLFFFLLLIWQGTPACSLYSSPPYQERTYQERADQERADQERTCQGHTCQGHTCQEYTCQESAFEVGVALEPDITTSFTKAFVAVTGGAAASIVDGLVTTDPSLRPITASLIKAVNYILKNPQLLKTARLKSFSKVITAPGHPSLTIKSLPTLKALVINLPSKQFYIGAGRHKTVTKVLLVKNNKIYIAVHCWGDKSTKREVEVLRAVEGKKGVVPFFGAIPHQGGKNYSIYLLYCNGGELRSFVRRNTPRLSLQERLYVARDITKGLQSLHAKGYIHYDIHAGNVFLLKTTARLKGILGDFGHTRLASKMKGRSGYVARRRVPPESLKFSIHSINRYKTDIHALGSVFYEMAWNTYHPWGFFLPQTSAHKLGPKTRHALYKKMVKGYLDDKSQKLQAILRRKRAGFALMAEEEFKILVFDVMHYNPSKRPSLKGIEARLTKILAKPG